MATRRSKEWKVLTHGRCYHSEGIYPIRLKKTLPMNTHTSVDSPEAIQRTMTPKPRALSPTHMASHLLSICQLDVYRGVSLVQCDGISATVKGVHKHVFTIHSDNRNKQENNYPGIDIPPFAFDGTEWPFTSGQGDIKWPQNMKWISYEPGQMPVDDMKRPISDPDFIKWANMGFDDKGMDFANTKNPSADFNSKNKRNKNNRRPSSNTEGSTVIPKDGNESTENIKYGENIEEISGESNDEGAFQNGEKNGKFIYRSTKTENMTGKDFVYICPEGMKRYLSHIFGMIPNARPSVDSSSYQIDSSESQSEPIKRIGGLRNRGNKKNFPNIQSWRRNSSDRKSQIRTQPRSLSILRKNNNR
ncbi:hypothetical protein TNIN_341981 [Trichonephila inaurata madagascariensis]|uniref:Uncharacterized protein n=1 Tax=Trichonephila inaurata madagascariensis TaxID=2747483 RepID=A0A8X7CG88_9ARAC|nr:hypothetical protein TNIN_341981 [Trichonephila inaurata madagascariensis]